MMSIIFPTLYLIDKFLYFAIKLVIKLVSNKKFTFSTFFGIDYGIVCNIIKSKAPSTDNF